MGNLMNIGERPAITALEETQKVIIGVTDAPPEALAVEAAANSCIPPVPVPTKANPRTTAFPEVIVVKPVAFSRTPFPTSST
jgi:hypothetical protein